MANEDVSGNGDSRYEALRRNRRRYHHLDEAFPEILMDTGRLIPGLKAPVGKSSAANAGLPFGAKI